MPASIHLRSVALALLGALFTPSPSLAETSLPAPASSSSPAAVSPIPKLPSIEYKLDNGLTVVLSPDPSAPIVATEIVYMVGSGHEPKGKTGFAHLFEHLMFQGSKHFDTEYFAPFEPIGAEVNGTTNNDRTNYYERVPRQFAELTLWMESDRMRSLVDVLDQAKLDNQRDVVKNERRQRYEMSPYGMAFWHMGEALYPPGHPYRHSPIGSHEDLTNASLDDVHAFFRKYYVPANAVLVVAGGFEEAEMRGLIEKYFGDIPGGSRAPRPVIPKSAEPSARPNRVHWVIEDQVQLPRVYLAFDSPALFETHDAELDLLSNILADGKSSRLYQSLVYTQKLAKDIDAYQISRDLAGVFVIQATLAPGVTLETFGPALERELMRALETEPSETELVRAKNAFKKDFYHRIESVGDRASLLGAYATKLGRADGLAYDYERYVNATAQSVLSAGKKFLSMDRSVRLDFVPGTRGAPVQDLTPKSPRQETQK
ncbi:MAG: hypothetical protein B6A08_03535 [Sorangiineae bacterium NIC37A_2]|nr:MAG: hypothetical protein B6A08_03535 [Sorangiineae bacterium NIC37A_2]